MAEPIYIRQTGDIDITDHEACRAWFRECGIDATAAGASWFRYSVHETLPLLLIEGWEDRPLDQGVPRWSLVAQEAQNVRG